MKALVLLALTLLGCERTTTTKEEPPRPLALAVVFNGQELWVGNETHETDENAQYTGALHDLVAAFDQLRLWRLPADSQGLVVSYAEGVRLVRPLGPVAEITGKTFGVQRDYRSQIGSDLVDGITAAAEMLPRDTRGVIVVIGDGNDSRNDTATMRLLVLRRALAQRGVAVHALVVPGPLSPDGEVISVLTPNLQTITSASLPVALEAIIQRESPAAVEPPVRSAGR